MGKMEDGPYYVREKNERISVPHTKTQKAKPTFIASVFKVDITLFLSTRSTKRLTLSLILYILTRNPTLQSPTYRKALAKTLLDP